MPATVYPKGTTIYRPKRCSNGYTGFAIRIGGRQVVRLIDMNGRVVNEWRFESTALKGGLPRARLLPNGHLLVLWGGLTFGTGGAQEYDWGGKLVWEYRTPAHYQPHHDVVRKENGNTLLICREVVPEMVRARAADPERRKELYADAIVEVTPENEVVWEWHQYEHLDIDLCNPILAPRTWWAGPDNNTITDWTHTNTVQALPRNRWHDAGDERFKPGNVLLSLRQLDQVFIVDRDSGQIVWQYTGDYKGGLSGQHDSHMIEKGLPGAGNIVIFDNGASPYKNLEHAGCSYVLEVNPTTNAVVWVYDSGERFHSNFTSSSQRLWDGTTLINEAAHGRLFEVSAQAEIVWEYLYPEGRASRAYRYAYDYCPRTAVLGQPHEMPVHIET